MSTERSDPDFLRQRDELRKEMSDLSQAAARHVEKIVQPYAQIQDDVHVIKTAVMHLVKESHRAQSARRAATRERLRRAASDAEWRKLRRKFLLFIGVVAALGEAYHAWRG